MTGRRVTSKTETRKGPKGRRLRSQPSIQEAKTFNDGAVGSSTAVEGVVLGRNPEKNKKWQKTRAVRPLLAAEQLAASTNIDLEYSPSAAYMSKVSRGKILMPKEVDGRTFRARRFREAYLQVVEDLGGTENITEIQRGLIRRFAAFDTIALELETKLLTYDNTFSTLEYAMVVNQLAKIAKLLGIERRSRLVNPGDVSFEESIGGFVQPPTKK